MRLTLLGTQGWIPTGRRETTCLALEDGPRLLLFDAGTGLRRLLEPPGSTMLAAARDVHLFLTHYHLDHVCGLAYLPGLFAGRRLTVHVPEPTINGVDLDHGLATLIDSPFNPGRWGRQRGMEIVTQTLREGANEVAGHEVRVRRQQHPDPTVGYRLDDAFAFVTDTVADPETARFAAGVELLLHEAWIDGVEESDPDDGRSGAHDLRRPHVGPPGGRAGRPGRRRLSSTSSTSTRCSTRTTTPRWSARRAPSSAAPPSDPTCTPAIWPFDSPGRGDE